ncbi:MAG: ribosomal protein S18-alanine N-acetyltransferase [Rudaea sp.]|uniref:ribosomal protein S18-alanine N-acetyltransferase n=1 Tax=Rudaea sp. TaxID=2136325 RepID=UPI0039E54638
MVAILAEPRPQMRAMRADDLDTVAALEAAAYEFPWTHGIFRDCLRAGYECWVLQHGAEIVGYGILSVAAGEAHLLNACIAPAHQGRGHGRHLVKRMIELARWHRVQRIFLEVRPSNRAALALYPTLGFNEIATRPNYYLAKHGREDAIVMAMELLPPED